MTVVRNFLKAVFCAFIFYFLLQAPAFCQDSGEHYDRGIRHLYESQYGPALVEFSKAVELAPFDARVYTTRGSLYNRLGELRAALADLNKAIMLDPDLPEAFANRAQVYYNQAEYEKASEDIEKTLSLDPQLASAYLVRGLIHNVKREYIKAYNDLNKAKQLFLIKNDKLGAKEAEDVLFIIGRNFIGLVLFVISIVVWLTRRLSSDGSS